MSFFVNPVGALSTLRRKKPSRSYHRSVVLHALLFLSVCFGAGQQAQAQWYWLSQSSGSGTQEPIMSATNAAGQTFVAGLYYTSSTFGSTTLTSAGSSDGFLCGLGSTGTINWAVSMGGTLIDKASAVVVSGSDIFVSGSFRGTATFGTTSGSTVTLTGPTGTDNFFIARYNSSGVLQWAQTLTTVGDCSPKDIELSSSLAKVYVSGNGGTGAFACCYSYTGVFQWNTMLASTSIQSGGLAVEPGGNSHILVGHLGTLTVGSATFNAPSGRRLLLVELDGSGNYVTGIHASTTSASLFNVRPEDVDIDGSGNLYIAGDYQSGSLVFPCATLTNTSGSLDGFLAKFNGSYSCLWATKTSGTGGEFINALCVDNAGNSFIGIENYANNSLTFDCYPAFVSTFGISDSKFLINKYNTSGAVDWIMAPSVVDGSTDISTLSTNGNGSVYASGHNVGTSVFGSFTMTASGKAYFTRVKGQSQVPVASGVTICSGNTATLTVTAPTPVGSYVFNWYNSSSSSAPVLGTGTSFTTPILTNTSSSPISYPFYVSNSACPNMKVVVPVTVNPVPNLSSVVTNHTTCNGGCVTIGLLTPVAGTTYAIYNNTSGTSVFMTSSSSITVCPTVPSFYTLVATNSYGCSRSVDIYVTPVSNNPNFSMTTNPIATNYFNVSATPVVPYATANSVAGFGYAWIVEELDAFGTPLFTVNNPSCWWTFHTTPTLVFHGFDHVSFPYSGSVTLSSCTTPANGKFLYNRTYRITRGTWNSLCSWSQYSETVKIVKNAQTGAPEITIEHGVQAPDFSGMMLDSQEETVPADLVVYPNPSNGVFMLNWPGQMTSEVPVVSVYDMTGRMVRSFRWTENPVRVDISEQPQGLYLVHIQVGAELMVKRVSIVR